MRSKTIKTLFSIGTLSLFMVSLGYAAPQNEGSWSALIDWPVDPVSNVLTPQGTVVSLGKDDNDGLGENNKYFYNVWNPELGTGSPSHTTLPDTLGINTSQSSAILVPETGKVLIIGGQELVSPNSSLTDTTQEMQIFDPQTGIATRIANSKMFHALTSTTVLPSGEILISNGYAEGRINDFGALLQLKGTEIFSPASNQTRLLPFSPEDLGGVESYNTPRQWVTRLGKIAGHFILSDRKTFSYDSGSGRFESVNDIARTDLFMGGSDVMYRPGKILHVTGRESSGGSGATFVIDTNSATPWVRETVTKPITDQRYSNTSVVLPNGKVMISGGQRFGSGEALPSEIWNPDTETWSLLAADTYTRSAESLLLLKDGRILLTGNTGIYANGLAFNPGLTAQIFSPPYLFNNSGQLASRPNIVSAPASAVYGNQVDVKHQAGNTISRVTLIKTGAVNASHNMEQRFIELNFTQAGDGVNVTLPSSSNDATPGYYLMYLLNGEGVPSKGHIIKISATVNSAYPVGISDTATSVGGALITIDALANDTGSGLTLNAPNAWSLKGGNVALVNNKITYKPKAGFNGEDKIWYVFRDSQGRANSGVIIITVSGNGASSPYPTSSQDNVTVTGGTQTTIDVLANDTGDGLVLNAPNAWSLNGGSVSLVGNKLVYTAKSGFSGNDNIWYTFKDLQGRSNTGQVNVTVNSGGSTAFPVAYGDYYTTTKNNGMVLDILDNDTASGWKAIDTLYEYTAKGGTSYKTPEGKVWYTPKADFTGEDNFWYVMIDSEGRKNSAQVKINVTP